jgi:serine protease Do
MMDVALLKVDDMESTHPLIMNTSFSMQPGQTVWAIGTPRHISLHQTLTKGVFSAYRDDNDRKLLQFDAKVNQGNSGGPLLNDRNEVIGIVSLKIIGLGVEGLGFAVSINDALKAMKLVTEEGEVDEN